ncbi:hypothetical protein D9Q98_001917 [Chlorella vulgaris]|uniref:Uncharacterized protein n=1 Tax=Chlorella vulgaris TaxID=3077 RepID=A0A9D4TVH7_CHLVU|nr:hypothetical protein D9Q98_001917 [Chlorella vulgaris]
MDVDTGSSLVLALGGFSIDADSDLHDKAVEGVVAAPVRKPDAVTAPDRQVAEGAATLVSHLCLTVDRLLKGWKGAGIDSLQQEAAALASLSFALQAALGPSTRLAQADERQLFDAAAALWGASLQAGGGSGAGAKAAAAALDRIGLDLFSLLDSDSDGSQDCVRYVSYFSTAARSWAAAGQRERARWCIERAMRNSQQLEALVTSSDVADERKQGLVVALFSLHLEGAKLAADGKQQALANNLLSRAVQLSRHPAVGPDAAACCAIAVAELQLGQAQQMLPKGGHMANLAAALLSSAVQQLTRSDLQDVAAGGGPHAAGLLEARKEVLGMLCRAHLASGEAGLASKALDALEAVAPGAAAADPALQLVFVEAKVAAGRVPEALRFLVAAVQPTDHAADPAVAEAAAGSFLAGLRLALGHITHDTLPSFQAAISAFVWKAVVAKPPTPLLLLVQTLLAEEKACELCQRLTLHALSGEDASAALHRDSGVLRQVHSLLFHRAAHCLEAGSCAAAKDLFGAALAHAGPEARARDARALAACHSRLGMQQRAVEYLQIAARHEGQQPSSLTQLMLLQALAQTGDTPQALAAITRLLACLDFHPSLLPAMCRAAAAARHPSVRKAAVSSAVQLLISPDAVASGLPHGREAQLLLELVRAISGCFQVVPSSVGTGCEVAGSGGASSGALYGELVAAVKLVAKRLKLLGWQAFAGAAADGAATMQAICGLVYNQLLAAQRQGAHEHVVALATATFQLGNQRLESRGNQQQADDGSAAQQAKVLLIATQALLDLHSRQPESGQKLALAVKLQARLEQHLPLLDVGQHAHLHLLHQLMCLEAESRQGDEAALLGRLGKLLPHASRLSLSQRHSVMRVVGMGHSSGVQLAAAELLFDSSAADASLSLAPALLSQLSLPGEVQLRVISRCTQLLADLATTDRNAHWAQHALWLAACAWNAGSKQVQPAEGRVLLGLALELQACAPAGGQRLSRMRAALAAAGSLLGVEGECRQEPAAMSAGKPQEVEQAVSAVVGQAAAMELDAMLPEAAEGSLGSQVADAAADGRMDDDQVGQPAPGTHPAGGTLPAEPPGSDSAPAASHQQPDSKGPCSNAASDAAAIPAVSSAAAVPEAMPASPPLASVPSAAVASASVLPASSSEDSLSEDSDEGELALAGAGVWLKSMLAAHKRQKTAQAAPTKRVLGASNGAGSQPRQQTGRDAQGRKAAAKASGTARKVDRKEQTPPAEVADADALSLCSMPGSAGFMGL